MHDPLGILRRPLLVFLPRTRISHSFVYLKYLGKGRSMTFIHKWIIVGVSGAILQEKNNFKHSEYLDGYSKIKLKRIFLAIHSSNLTLKSPNWSAGYICVNIHNYQGVSGSQYTCLLTSVFSVSISDPGSAQFNKYFHYLHFSIYFRALFLRLCFVLLCCNVTLILF